MPEGPGGYTRAILESLAFKYRFVIDCLCELTGHAIEEVQIVGGGSRNRLLNQFTADATGCTVIAGPIEATALGNLAMQMVGSGAVGTLSDARCIIDRSFPTERYRPARHRSVELTLSKISTVPGVDLCLKRPLSKPLS